MVCLVVSIHLRTETLINCCHIAILDAPVPCTEEVYIIEDAQQCGIDAFGRPDGLVVWINLAANICPRCKRAAIAKGIPEENDWLPPPVKEMSIVTIMSEHIAQGSYDCTCSA